MIRDEKGVWDMRSEGGGAFQMRFPVVLGRYLLPAPFNKLAREAAVDVKRCLKNVGRKDEGTS